MSSDNHRILLHLTMQSGNIEAIEKAETVFMRLNNKLNGHTQFPNLAKFCEYCEDNHSALGSYVRNKCLDVTKIGSYFDEQAKKTDDILYAVTPSERKNIRIMLYPGEENDIEVLNMYETTHNMIVRFVDEAPWFSVTDPHTQPPSFYQRCSSTKAALLYLEALLVDACVCHFLSVSDVAAHHDDKQHISSEKVLFLKEITQNGGLKKLSPTGKELVEFVSNQINNDTPYISFFSIFTIAPLDLFGEKEYYLFDDYCDLWSIFQKWYFNRHGRVFSKREEIEDPLSTVFNRNKYKGQISPSKIAEKITEYIDNPVDKVSIPLFGIENRYAVIVVKHKVRKSDQKEHYAALFSEEIHPCTWDVKYWGDLERYDKIRNNLEIVPFMIDE